MINTIDIGMIPRSHQGIYKTGITTLSEGWNQRIVVVSVNSPIDEAQFRAGYMSVYN